MKHPALGLRSICVKGREVLSLYGKSVDVDCSFNMKKASALTLIDLESYDLIIYTNSRLKVTDNQVFGKSQIIYLIREGCHCSLT